MSTYSALYYHIIWSTKERKQLIQEVIENKLYAYIAGIVQSNKNTMIQLGGMPDHIHMLVRLSPDQNIPELVKTIKIASGKWMKAKGPDFSNFSWQNGYGAFSVSKSQTDVVKCYIANQKEHHRTRGFEEEWLAFLKNNDIEYNEKYVLG